MTHDTAAGRRSRVLSWSALGVVYLAWGSTYLAIRVGVGHLPPFFLAGIRYVIAGALLYPVGRWAAARDRGPGAGSARPGWKAWLAGGVIGILLLFAGNGGVTVAETTLPSGLAAVLVATVPLWMILFAWPVQGQRATWRSAGGLVAGLAGVAILVGGTASGRISGVLIVLGASAAWGFGSVLGHRLPLPSQAMVAAAIEMLTGGAVLLAVAAGTGEFGRIHGLDQIGPTGPPPSLTAFRRLPPEVCPPNDGLSDYQRSVRIWGQQIQAEQDERARLIAEIEYQERKSRF